MKKTRTTTRMLGLRVPEGLSREWHWSDRGSSYLNLGSDWLKQDFVISGDREYGGSGLGLLTRAMKSSLAVTSFFSIFSGILTCTEPNAERRGEEGRGGENLPVSFFKVNENHSQEPQADVPLNLVGQNQSLAGSVGLSWPVWTR